MSDQWLSIVEYARYFSLSDMTVRRRIKTGKLRAVLKDGKYYIPLKHERFAGEPPPPHHSGGELARTPSPPTTARWPSEPGYADSYQQPAANGDRHFGGARPQAPTSVAPNQRRPYEERPPHVQRSHIEVKPRRPSPSPSPLPNVAALNQNDAHSSAHIPADISTPLSQQSNIMLESKALLNFCERVITRLNESEKRLEGDFENKLASLEAKAKSLEAQLGAKEVKLVELQQQVEDLQLLVQIIEKQKPR